jgi:hypothetical protein
MGRVRAHMNRTRELLMLLALAGFTGVPRSEHV